MHVLSIACACESGKCHDAIKIKKETLFDIDGLNQHTNANIREVSSAIKEFVVAAGGAPGMPDGLAKWEDFKTRLNGKVA